MKKKVVTTLLSAMLCVSMVPVPVMAFEDDAESIEISADDFGSESTEENSDVEIAEEDTENNTENDVDVIEEESTDETGTEGAIPSDSGDETDFFSDDAQAGTVTLNGTVLKLEKPILFL